MKTASQAQHF